MASPQRFANYPKPCQGPATPYQKAIDRNPVLRGWTLAVASHIVSWSPSFAKLLHQNAKFHTVKDIPGLDEYHYRLDPTVIPIADEGETTAAEFDEELFKCQPANSNGRYYSVADYHELYKSQELTPLQVVESLLPVISRDKASPGKYASAFVHSDTDRVLAAARVSTERYVAGKPLGLLDGVPFGVKDDTDVEGYISHWGLAYNPKLPFFPASKTSEPVKRLLDAGGIMIGKQVQHELGTDTSGFNVNWGTPINWFNNQYYCGGSSTGAGSAIGAGIVPISIGTDSGGSVRVPAAYNGHYSLKPSISRTCTMTATACVTGPMASTVTDLTVAYRLLAQADPEDPVQSLFARSKPLGPSAKKLIGIYNDWFHDARPDVADACKKAIAYFKEKLGYETVDISIPYIREGQLAHAMTCLAESADQNRTKTPNPADNLSLVGAVNKILLPVGAQTTAVDQLKAGQLRALHMSHMAYLFKEYPGLMVLTPTTPDPPLMIHPGDATYGFNDADWTIRSMRYTWLANWTGCPAAVAPVGYVDPAQGEGKLPLSLMAMGEWGAEEQLLVWARDAERYLNEEYPGGRQRPKEWADVVKMAKKNGQKNAA